MIASPAVVREFSRTPRPEWEAELERITPRSDRLSYLLIRWHPGFVRPGFINNRGVEMRKARWIPVERWIIYQLNPNPRTYPQLLWAPVPRTGNRLRVRPVVDLARKAMDRVQWSIYLETGRYAQPFWVVQGDRGGHKRNYSDIESRLSLFHGGPAAPPSLGELPYAEPDERTFSKLRMLDQVRFWNKALSIEERDPDFFDAEDQEVLKDFRRQLWNWMDDRAYEATEGWREGTSAIWKRSCELAGVDSLPPGFKDTTDYEAEERAFIEESA
jgi:hypothetical protein